MLERSASTSSSFCSAVSGLDPLSFDLTTSIAGTFQNKKTHWLCFGLDVAVDVSFSDVVVGGGGGGGGVVVVAAATRAVFN